MNIFDNSSYYLEFVDNVKLDEEIIESKKLEHGGKTILCAWLTKLCPAQCKACFFKSNMYKDENPREQYELSEEGITNLIKFINDSNNSYLMLSGGGEPMIRPNEVNRLIRETKTERIVIVTSGIWSKNKEVAEKYIDELYNSLKSRNDDTKLILRLSIDQFHYESPTISFENYNNIINIFKEKYSNEPNFELRIHTMQNDSTLQEIIEKIGNAEIKYSKMNGTTDNQNVIKIVPKKATVEFNDGYKIEVGLSKLFYPNMKIDIHKINDDIKKALDIFEKDMKVSEYSNPSIITNCNGLQGLDFWSDYNGNITAWGCQQTNDLHSIYTNTYDEIVNKIYSNISSYSFLDKGYYYRRNIIKEVNPYAVLRSEAINLRDYAGAFLMEENPTKLYYAIRVIKDYLDEGILTEDNIKFLPKELLECIKMDTEELNKKFNSTSYDIITQYFENKERYTKEDWEDLFILIRAGHYKINSANLRKALDYYNEKYNSSLDDINKLNDPDDEAQLARLHNRISPMQERAKKLCLSKHSNN